MAEPVGLRHVQRHPCAALVEHFELMVREEIENARFEILVAAGRDRGRSGRSTPSRPRLAAGPILRPARSADHCGRTTASRYQPRRTHSSADSRCRPRCRIPATACRSQGTKPCGRETPISWQRWASAAPIGSITSLTQYCRRFSSLAFLEAESRLVDVCVGVENLGRQPGFQVLVPKGPIDVGVLPDVVQRNRIHRDCVSASFHTAKVCM